MFSYRFNFRLRSLLLATALVALGLGALGWRVAQVRIERSVAGEIERLGGYVRFDGHAPSPAWLTQWLGDDLFAEVYLIECDSRLLSDSTLEHLAKLRHLEWLLLDSDRITDRGVSQLAALDGLRRLDLASRQITDQGLAALENLSSLRWLALRRTAATSASIERLRLALPDCQIQWEPAAPAKSSPLPPTPELAADQLARW